MIEYRQFNKSQSNQNKEAFPRDGKVADIA